MITRFPLKKTSWVLGVVLGIGWLVSPGTGWGSTIYKWTDERGVVHFTDDPLKIPPRYRTSPELEKREISIGAPSGEKSPAGSRLPAGTSPTEAPEQDSELTDAERQAMTEAIEYLQNDIQRYQEFEGYVSNRRTGRMLSLTVHEALPEKKAMAEKLSEFDEPLLKETAVFLKQSIAADEQVPKLGPLMTRNFRITRSRLLDAEQPVKEKLIQKLETRLREAAEREEALRRAARESEPPKPPPVQPEEKSPARKDGSGAGD
ncbi:MAG: DUF4124 domain-containing protein [Nitrospinaceae bacterium]|nr:DUF4124 domain-containing protein [Nitrospinaceae bacterium]NIR53237.1 DUF4124 domain-containing protein [Nitrospinaceae bacterium]NIS83632.1 DUF4124 domain-containing protein [Nitrospinaceae bacterium]NIT80422.1 DUF4124 domain-containing protein [Nitrospinaceae bacterium]NIU42765.1 DUF4124 domain-containing protein [Nitrospinaceae bacterium]